MAKQMIIDIKLYSLQTEMQVSCNLVQASAFHSNMGMITWSGCRKRNSTMSNKQFNLCSH